LYLFSKMAFYPFTGGYPMITLQSVSKLYGPVRAVDGISLQIEEGEITGLLGPNGAGKTTTMRMITGYFRPTSGSILVDTMDPSRNPEAVKSIIGYLPESPPLYGEMMTWDYLRYIIGVRKISDPDALEKSAELCGITSVLHKRIDQLSKGYKQRVGLAQAIIHDPKILILDEPTSGLDPNQIADVRALIRDIGKRRTIILSTHILQEVEAVADRVVIINRGRIVEDDRTGNLQAHRDGRSTIRIALTGAGAEEASRQFASVRGVMEALPVDGEEELSTVEIVSALDDDIRPQLFSLVKERGWTLYEMSRKKESLEAVFRELTTGGEYVQHA
jgi:ABC-2 type transport system ATP-binding protein